MFWNVLNQPPTALLTITHPSFIMMLQHSWSESYEAWQLLLIRKKINSFKTQPESLEQSNKIWNWIAFFKHSIVRLITSNGIGSDR